MTTEAKSSTVKLNEDEPTLGPTMSPKRPRHYKGQGISQQVEMATGKTETQETTRDEVTLDPSKAESTTGEAESSAQGTTREEPTPGPSKVSSQKDNWELVSEIRLKPAAKDWSDCQAIAARQDEIAVVRFRNNQVVICSNDGKKKSSIPFPKGPRYIAVQHIHNRLVVAECFDPNVKVLNSDNTLAYEFETTPQSEFEQRQEADKLDKPQHVPGGVAVKKEGTILVADQKRNVYTEHRPTDGKLLRTIPVKRTPVHLAVDSKDRVIISGKEGVDVTDGNGIILFTLEPTICSQSARECGSVYGDSSGLYVPARLKNFFSGHIHHYDLDGRFLCCLAQRLPCPTGITFTSDGQMAVAAGNSIQLYRKV
ncbi:uncharacterized protein LOC119732958 [Patiria miniata]|uniref:Uncharacterized protein n=1 Tax=Patiria miniata TaxID=46514 RepID=A0A914AG29_PATMI|nr:uncharacterized protein LOC119732958 [Patiria miniata]